MRLRATIPVLTCCLGAASALQLEGMRATRAQPLRSAAPLMEADAVLDKRAERRRIMAEERYKRGAAPFSKDVHAAVNEKMSARFKSELLREMKESPMRELSSGEGAGKVTFMLAKEYGFCWGVERSIELAWAAREAYPEKTIHITNELIHNPGVNQLLGGMGIKFMEKDSEAVGGKHFDAVGQGDVVILPAFGASLEEMQHFDKQGVTVVDTTCPWVSKVWNAVDKHKAKSLTSVIHGKWQHEEAIATASMCENYIIVKNIDEAEELAAYILGEPGALSDEELLHKYRHAVSKGFEPKKHLRRVGVANQTTMYKKETQAIGRLLEKTMMAAHGPENIQDNFAAFDTICDATQVRQDAVQEMSEQAKETPLDFVLVVGGWDSSNTAHLLEIPHEMGLSGYHVNVKECIRPDNSVEWRTVDGEVKVTENFLPLDRPARIGVTSGASTPDSVVQECLERIVMLKKLGLTAEDDGGEADEEHDSAEEHDSSEAVVGPPPAGFEWAPGTY
mmetsp:Transcript_7825/g.13186  ORF Transcript_7825/g.13186 Transcript_7825/m.13186 type:complete len:506 (-) Transcript_7825:318-1835(-)